MSKSPTQNNKELPQNLRLSKRVMLGAYFGLMAYYLVLAYVSVNTFNFATLTIWLFYCLPLLLFLPGILSDKIKVHAWLSFLVLMYFVHGVLTAFEPQTLILGLIESALSTSLFCCLIVFIRQYRDHYKASLFY